MNRGKKNQNKNIKSFHWILGNVDVFPFVFLKLSFRNFFVQEEFKAIQFYKGRLSFFSVTQRDKNNSGLSKFAYIKA